MSDEKPTYNLKAVVQETGIRPDTLRAWERRYGVPLPARSPGGHRMYSRRDIDTLLWLVGRQREGLRISRAVEQWRALEDAGRDPLLEPAYALGHRRWPRERHTGANVGANPGGREPREYSFHGGEIGAMRQAWLTACMDFDSATAEGVLAQAFAVYPLETVCLELLCQSMRQAGEEWHIGKVTAHQVIFAAALAMQRIEILLGASPQPTRPGQILIACPPGEQHIFGQTLFQLLLKRRGYGTIYLGENVPMEEMESTLHQIRPDLVILSAQLLISASNLLEMSRLIAKEGVPVAYGGRIFDRSESIRRVIPGYYLGADLEQALQSVDSLLSISPSVTQTAPIADLYSDALACFQSRVPAISAYVATALQNLPLKQSSLSRATISLAQNIVSALKFGDISLLAAEAGWLVVLLKGRDLPMQILEQYLFEYMTAVRMHLGSGGDVIMDMLEMFLNEIRSVGRREERGEE